MKILRKIQGIAVGSAWTIMLMEIFGMIGKEHSLIAEEVWTLGNSFSVLMFVLFSVVWTSLTLDYFKNN